MSFFGNSLKNSNKLIIISGPCVIESENHALMCADFLTELFARYHEEVIFIFKSSYDKANRSSINSFRGPGLNSGLEILKKIKNTFNVPVLTDVHSAEEASIAGQFLDIIQIPAFLCRQTDILVSAGQTPATVNVKKSQFMSPWEMKHVVEKLRSIGKTDILLTERGSFFGYNNLVSDMRSIPIMQDLKCPVIFDGTHSVQLPGALTASSGGQREFIPVLTKAALAADAEGLFVESHPNPSEAKSDSASMLSFNELSKLLPEWIALYKLMQQQKECLSLS